MGLLTLGLFLTSDVYGATDVNETVTSKAGTKPNNAGSGIPSQDALTHAAGFLAPQDLANMAKVSHGYRRSAILPVVDTYAECVVLNQPVPIEAKQTLFGITDPAARKKLTGYIVNKINALTGESILALTNPLPPFLQPFFKQIIPADLVHLAPQIRELVESGTVLPAALLHMDTCLTFWAKADKSPKEIDQAIIKHAQSYTTLVMAQTIPAGTPVPKYIIATEAEIRDVTQRTATNAFFQAHPNTVLVLNVGSEITIRRFAPSLLANIRQLAIVGRNLTTIGRMAFYDYTGLTNITIPNSVKTMKYGVFANCTSFREIWVEKDSAAERIMRQDYPAFAQYIRYITN